MDKLLIPLALLPVVAGFIFSRTWEISRYQVARSDGQKLYLTSAYHGYFIALVLFILIWSFDRWIFNLCLVYGRCFGHFSGLTFVLSPLLAWPVAKILNQFVNEYDYWSKVVKANELEKTLLYASHDSEPVMVSLKNNKVYVGYVTMIADPNQQNDREWIELFLFLSGYRDHESRVHYTLNYSEIAQKVLFPNMSNTTDCSEQNQSTAATNDQDEIDTAYQSFMIALPVSEIVSVHRYDEQIALMAQQAQDTAQKEKQHDQHRR